MDPRTPTGRSLADGETDGLTEMIEQIEAEAYALALVPLKSLLSEYRAGGAGSASIAAIGEAIRRVEAAAPQTTEQGEQ